MFELKLYQIDMKYIRNLHRIDDRVLSVSPQTGKDERPFLGILLICGDQKYCVPLSKPKEKHYTMRNKIDFKKIELNDELLGVLNFNLMIPVEYKQIKEIDITIRRHDDSRTRRKKELLGKELKWCNDHYVELMNTANVLYNMYITNKYFAARQQCLDFKRMEEECIKYNNKN